MLHIQRISGYIITLANLEEIKLPSESCNGTEIGGKYDDDSTLPPLLSEAEMDEMPSGDEFYAELMSTNILEDIDDISQSHLIINRREARYKIRDCIKQRRAEWKGALLSTQNMGKVLHKVFKAVFNELS